MVGHLLVRGMLVGILAGLLAFGFARIFGEPAVDRAIAFESALDEAKAHEHAPMGMPAEPAEPELVSRPTQAGIGLFTGVVVYCTAFGGLFALVFAAANGRVGRLSPRAVAAVLAGLGFVAVYLVPILKYPPNPPSVGEPETIGLRTGLFFLMLLVSVVAMTGAVMLRNRLAPSHGGWSAAIIAAAVYIVAMAVAMLAMPAINEVPEQFPATLLWQFRIAAVGTQVMMWSAIGLTFGWLTERAAETRRLPRAAAFPSGRL